MNLCHYVANRIDSFYLRWRILDVFRFLKITFGSTFVALIAIAGLGGMNLHTYQRFTSESPVATLSFQRLQAGSYLATLVPMNGPVREFALHGDEWQLDVRMIKWSNWLTLLGEEPLFRLDRLSGRSVRIKDEKDRPRSLYALNEEDGIDVWSFARRSGDWLPGIDASYGSSVYLPMKDGASYDISMSSTGLLARLRTNGEPH